MTIQVQALDLLAQGISQVQVAAALGVTESAISQLMSDEDFKLALDEKKSAQTEANCKFDTQLERAEQTYLDRIEAKAPVANLQQSLQAFKILNSAKRRRDSSLPAVAAQANVVVQIQLPAQFTPPYVTNQNNEIVEVDGKTMVSASPRRLNEIIAARTGIDPSQVKQQLPGVTKVERAAVALESLTNTPVRRLTKSVKSEDLVDLL